MAATLLFGDRRAYVTGGKWFSGDADLAQICQESGDLVVPPAWAPDADNFIAAQVAASLGAVVVEENPPAPPETRDDELVY